MLYDKYENLVNKPAFFVYIIGRPFLLIIKKKYSGFDFLQKKKEEILNLNSKKKLFRPIHSDLNNLIQFEEKKNRSLKLFFFFLNFSYLANGSLC